MEYELPTLKDEKEIKSYLQECFVNGENDVIISQDLLMDNYEKWVIQMHNNANDGNGDWGRSYVLLCYDNTKLIGILCVRYEPSHELEAIYGNIGYSVRPSQRRKGYATRMLRYALRICKEKDLEKVILGCHSDNTASSLVIKKCGGILIDIVEESPEVTNHYYEIKISLAGDI